MESPKPKTNRTSLKLRKGRRHHFQFPKGCRLIVETASSDGKPAILVEYPDGTVIRHETLTPPPAAQ